MDIQTAPLTETFAWREAPSAEFAVIAEDASHSLSPRMHNVAFKALGLPYRYVALNVPRGEVAAALEQLRIQGYIGVNVTVPHKEEARGWCAEFVNPDYPEVQVANTIRLSSREGFNTDTIGFLQSVSKFGLGNGNRCLVLGAGGSALACIAVLLKLGCGVSLWNRTHSRAQEMAAKFGNRIQLLNEPLLKGFDLIVNATSVGKTGGQLPIDWKDADPGQIAYDLFYSAGSTEFLRRALTKRLKVQDGKDLLVYQGAAAWRHWGLPDAPVDLMVKEVESALKG